MHFGNENLSFVVVCTKENREVTTVEELRRKNDLLMRYAYEEQMLVTDYGDLVASNTSVTPTALLPDNTNAQRVSDAEKESRMANKDKHAKEVQRNKEALEKQKLEKEKKKEKVQKQERRRGMN
eukprot:c4716_g1_i2.p1 GENE.c4716_g1_i2~~c4716_g1_i2.p1  ORF type:complete len:124 (+),score=32.10 c4716_g1_i2:103-474(+)